MSARPPDLGPVFRSKAICAADKVAVRLGLKHGAAHDHAAVHDAVTVDAVVVGAMHHTPVVPHHDIAGLLPSLRCAEGDTGAAMRSSFIHRMCPPRCPGDLAAGVGVVWRKGRERAELRRTGRGSEEIPPEGCSARGAACEPSASQREL